MSTKKLFIELTTKPAKIFEDSLNKTNSTKGLQYYVVGGSEKLHWNAVTLTHLLYLKMGAL